MPASPSTTVSKDGLTLTVYPGDGAALLGFSLDKNALQNKNLAGFAIQCIPPTGHPYYLPNRLNYSQPVTSTTTPGQRVWTTSDKAPFQKFHWVHFPPDVVPGTFRYRVAARYWQGSDLTDGPSAEVSVELVPAQPGTFDLGFTRGYLTSQAYATKFGNKDIRQEPKTLDYATASFEAQYEWLGYHARKTIFRLLQECVADPSVTVDLFAYDLDEPDILKMLEALGPRLRAFLDNATLHTGQALEVQAHDRLVRSAGAANIKQGHFKRFAHDKIIIQKRNGSAVKVLTGSANFSVRGLYVQANNVLLFDNPRIADLYEQVFERVFTDMKGFPTSPQAARWYDFPNEAGVPSFSVSFAPHTDASVSLGKVTEALKGAKSSVLFAVMELGGAGGVLSTLQQLHTGGSIFSYGITQSDAGFSVYKPGQPGVLVPFAALDSHVPSTFAKEWRGGPGQVIHDKFIVVDFNDANPVVFTGSSNLAEGGEKSNGDNLLAISDRNVVVAFAVEAIRLVDHYHFRAAMQAATDAKPLMLSPSDSPKKWYARDYDPNDIRNVERLLFASGRSSLTTIPHGAPGSGGKGSGGQPGKKKSKPAAKKKIRKPKPSVKPKSKTRSQPKTRKTTPRARVKRSSVRKPRRAGRKR
jgi:phosphatidylserine/phosphatidylglycerophosphate/cardiolipin synthase-like enzyme